LPQLPDSVVRLIFKFVHRDRDCSSPRVACMKPLLQDARINLPRLLARLYTDWGRGEHMGWTVEGTGAPGFNVLESRPRPTLHRMLRIHGHARGTSQYDTELVYVMMDDEDARLPGRSGR